MRRHARKVGVAVFMSTALALGTMATIAPAGAAPTKPAAPAKPTATRDEPEGEGHLEGAREPRCGDRPVHGGRVGQQGRRRSRTIFKSKAVTQVVSGLKNGTTYTFKVRAHNKVGWGPYSVQSAPVRIGAPVAPAAPAVIRGNATVRVNWKAPATNGAPITGYVVTPVVGTTAGTPRVFNSTALVQNITGLTNGVAYKFKVAAKNARGNGPASALSAAATPTATPALRAVIERDDRSADPRRRQRHDRLPVHARTAMAPESTVHGALKVAWPYVLWGGTTSVGPGLDVDEGDCLSAGGREQREPALVQRSPVVPVVQRPRSGRRDGTERQQLLRARRERQPDRPVAETARRKISGGVLKSETAVGR